MITRLVFALLVMMALIGCTQEKVAATAIAITVKSDLEPARLGDIEFRVYRGSSDAAASELAIEQPLRRPWQDVQDGAYVIEKGKQERDLLISVIGYAKDSGMRLVEASVRVRFVPEQTRAVPIFLAKACGTCEAHEVCTTRASENNTYVAACEDAPAETSFEVRKAGEESKWFKGGAERIDGGPGGGRDGGSPEAAQVFDGGSAPDDARVLDGRIGDAADTCSPSRDGGVCSVRPQCGCRQGSQHCQVRGNPPAPVCAPYGSTPVNAECASDDECQKGLDCVGSVCRAYCSGTDDCKGDCVAIPSERGELPERVCVEGCDLGTKCGGTGVSCVPRKGDDEGRGACLLPALSCKEDGVCDEPVIGNGTCATTTDKRDCCPKLSGMMMCDLVSSCGCQVDKACQLSGPEAALMTSCIGAGLIERGRQCMRHSDCKKGLGCWDRLCAKYCEVDDDCGMGGRCTAVGPTGTPLASVKYCRDACIHDGNTGCTAPAQCARFANYEAFCFLPRDPCMPPYDRAGLCDETTRVCAAGTDRDCRP